jgi:hypothetical protein
MTDEACIERFQVPTMAQLKDLPCDDEARTKIIAILDGTLDPCEASEKCAAWVRSCYNTPDHDSHEVKLCAIDELLGTFGVEALNIDGDGTHTDEGIRMCPAFSYCNAGDPYVATLLRDHVAGAWLVAGYGDALEEYERENHLGDSEEHDECPEECPECGRKAFTLEFFPSFARGPSFSWVCNSCNRHAFAVPGDVTISNSDGETAQVHALVDVFTVLVDGSPWPCEGGSWSSAQEAREAFLRGTVSPETTEED